jgi:hypothetical protein
VGDDWRVNYLFLAGLINIPLTICNIQISKAPWVKDGGHTAIFQGYQEGPQPVLGSEFQR